MKKFGILVLTVLLICSLVACKSKNPAQQTPVTTQPATQTAPAPAENKFLRLQSVTIEKELESETVTETVDVVWTDNGCEFTLNGKPLRAALDPETNVLSLQYADSTEPVFGYDENGMINRMFMLVDSEYTSISVSYDEQGYPVTSSAELQQSDMDPQSKTFRLLTRGAAYEDEEGNEYTSNIYEVFHMGANDTITSVEELEIEMLNGKEISRETVESSICFVYDEHGNLLSLQLGYLTFTFTYTQEVIHHSWERIVPLGIAAGERMWYQQFPLFWNVK